MVSFSARALAVGDQPFLGASKMKNGIQNSAAANAFPVLEFRPPARKRKNFPNRFCGPLPPAPRSRGRTPSNASLAHHAAAANGERDSGWRIQSGSAFQFALSRSSQAELSAVAGLPIPESASSNGKVGEPIFASGNFRKGLCVRARSRGSGSDFCAAASAINRAKS